MSMPRTDPLEVALAFPARTADPDHAGRPNPPARAELPDLPWSEARRRAARAAPPLPPVTLPLAACPGTVLSAPLTSRTDLPAFDTSAMDGWAVASPGPWRLLGPGVPAGTLAAPLADGCAVPITTGARLPAGATAVLRREHGRPVAGDGGVRGLRARTADLPAPVPAPGRDIRLRAGECRSGEQLLPEGTPVTPAVLGLAAAVGHDELSVIPRPKAALLVLGDELLDQGRPDGARVRDALGPLLAAWLPQLGAELVVHQRVPDDQEALRRAVRSAAEHAEVIITTGGTAAGPTDFVHPVLAELGARLLVDGVAVRPGHPMLLAELPAPEPEQTPRHLVGLPGNPFAAVAGMLTLAAPLLAARAGRPAPPRSAEPPAEAIAPGGRPGTVRLIPAGRGPDGLLPLRHDGPAMLRSLAVAEVLAVVPAEGAAAGEPLEVLPLRPEGPV